MRIYLRAYMRYNIREGTVNYILVERKKHTTNKGAHILYWQNEKENENGSLLWSLPLPQDEERSERRRKQ